MIMSPMSDFYRFKMFNWRKPQSPQLEAQLLSLGSQYATHKLTTCKSHSDTDSDFGSSPFNSSAYSFLIVDDNEINLRIFSRVLRRIFPNSVIDTVQNSSQIDPAALSSYKIVFLDIEMPIVTGVDIANAVRSHSWLDSVGLIAVTTKSTSADLKAYKACGFDLMIPKPVHKGYTGILRDIESVLRLRCNKNIATSAALPDLIPDSDSRSSSCSSSSSGSGTSPEDMNIHDSALPLKETVFLAL